MEYLVERYYKSRYEYNEMSNKFSTQTLIIFVNIHVDSMSKTNENHIYSHNMYD